MKKVLLLFACVSGYLLPAQAQIEYPVLSPGGHISQVVGFTTFTIRYERPLQRGRDIFGALVPHGKLWRAGAGHCTVISFDKDVVMNGKIIKQGAYSLFTIPAKRNGRLF